MIIGDAHIYEEHFDNANKELNTQLYDLPRYKFTKQDSLYTFWPNHIDIVNYKYNNNIKYLLKE